MNYSLKNLSDIDLKQWQKFFNNIPKDNYVLDGFRYKKICWLKRSTLTDFEILPLKPAVQSKTYNPIFGDIIRHYPPIEEEMILRDDFKSFLNIFSNYCDLTYDDIIFAQLQRIDCSINGKGLTVIEGFHQDDCKWVGLFVISRNNITGGETQLKNLSGEIFFKHTIQEGELLIIDDRQMLHFTTPIQIDSDQLNNGYRDVLIVTSCARHQMSDTN